MGSKRGMNLLINSMFFLLPFPCKTAKNQKSFCLFFFHLLLLVLLYNFTHYHPFLPDLQPAPPVGFNVTFVCPEGQVFDHDWFASAFVLITCGLNGAFDAPDWSGYSCVLREYMTKLWIKLNISFSSYNYRML